MSKYRPESIYEFGSSDVIAYQYAVSFADLVISPKEITDYLGYSTGAVNEIVQNEVVDILQSLPNILEPKAGFIRFSSRFFSVKRTRFFLSSVPFHSGKVIANNLRKADSAILFAVTAGEKISELITKENQNGDSLRAYIYDAVGSILAEKCADFVEERVEELLRNEGLHYTNRYSPGYCGWDVIEQKKLFSILPTGFCGISLTNSSLMQPIKSVSGVIGIGKEVSKETYTCDICDIEFCYWRRTH